ncbi:MAG: DUF6760 family protein [Actinomycetes bacterium]
MLTVGSDRLWEEIGFLAYYLHWPLDELLDLPNGTRERLLAIVSGINEASSGVS